MVRDRGYAGGVDIENERDFFGAPDRMPTTIAGKRIEACLRIADADRVVVGVQRQKATRYRRLPQRQVARTTAHSAMLGCIAPRASVWPVGERGAGSL